MLEKKHFEAQISSHELPGELLVENRYTDQLIWSVAEKYSLKTTKGNEFVEAVNDASHRLYQPLNDPNLFQSFVRTYSSNRDNMYKKVLGWVESYGLLRLEDPDKKPSLTQKTEKMWDLSKEVEDARSLAHVYRHLSPWNPQDFAKRIEKLRKESAEKELPELDRGLVELWKKYSDPTLRSILAQSVFKAVLISKLSGVRLSLQELFESPHDSSLTYAPSRSYRCPDLYSAIYLQFYLAITERIPMKLCENPACRTPFFARRKDQMYCKSGCRSSNRASRRKNRS